MKCLVFLLFHRFVFGFSFRTLNLSLDSNVVLRSPPCRKRINFKWLNNNTGDLKPVPLELPATVALRDVRNSEDLCVLSIDYGSSYIGMSFNYLDEVEYLDILTNEGDVGRVCIDVYDIIKNSRYSSQNCKFLIVVGFPIAYDSPTDGRLLFQTIYNLDFATKLSRFIHEQFGAFVGGDSNVRFENKCLSCTFGIEKCLYNGTCSEIFNIIPGGNRIPVLGVTEIFSTYQVDYSLVGSRKDSYASHNIYKNFKELGKQYSFLILPSRNEIFKSHVKSDCYLLYKSICKCINERG